VEKLNANIVKTAGVSLGALPLPPGTLAQICAENKKVYYYTKRTKKYYDAMRTFHGPYAQEGSLVWELYLESLGLGTSA